MKNEFLIYRPNELLEHIEVRIEDETVWLNPLVLKSFILTKLFEKQKEK